MNTHFESRFSIGQTSTKSSSSLTCENGIGIEMLKLSSTVTGERVDGKDLVMDIYKVVDKSILFTPMTTDIRHRVTISLCYDLL